MVTKWLFGLQLFPRLRFITAFFSFFFFFFFSAAIVDFVNCEQCICALFTIPQITLFNNFFIKNGSHSTIYTFKNYFATVFSVSVFSFSKNKFNPNTPKILIEVAFLNFLGFRIYLWDYGCVWIGLIFAETENIIAK